MGLSTLEPCNVAEATLLKAAEILNARTGTAAQRVEEALTEIWSAMFERSWWPPDLLGKADGIMFKILINGPIKATVPKMDDETLEETAASILDLAAEAQAALSPNAQMARAVDTPERETSRLRLNGIDRCHSIGND